MPLHGSFHEPLALRVTNPECQAFWWKPSSLRQRLVEKRRLAMILKGAQDQALLERCLLCTGILSITKKILKIF
jgi:hypothetical protein